MKKWLLAIGKALLAARRPLVAGLGGAVVGALVDAGLLGGAAGDLLLRLFELF